MEWSDTFLNTLSIDKRDYSNVNGRIVTGRKYRWFYDGSIVVTLLKETET